MERDTGRLNGYYIIRGAGRVDRSAARELARRPAQFVFIEMSRTRQDRGVIILAIHREAGLRFHAAPDDCLDSDHFLIAMGEPQQLRELELTAGSQA